MTDFGIVMMGWLIFSCVWMAGGSGYYLLRRG